MNPRITEAVLDKLRPGWREHRANRKSPWNLLCVLVGFGLAMLAWYYLFQAAWWLHVQCYPEHAALKKEFWHQGISARAFLCSFLMLMPLAVPALVTVFCPEISSSGSFRLPGARWNARRLEIEK